VGGARSISATQRAVRPGWVPTRWTGLMPDIIALDDTEIAMTEACNVAVLVFGETYELAGEGLADEYFVTAPLDRAIPAYTSNLMIGVVPGIFRAGRQSVGRRPPMCRRRRLLERFMRTFLVVQRSEGTPTGPRSARYYIFFTLGLVALSTFMRSSGDQRPRSAGVVAMLMRLVDVPNFRCGCLTARHVQPFESRHIRTWNLRHCLL
jgi:hypothetical protein